MFTKMRGTELHQAMPSFHYPPVSQMASGVQQEPTTPNTATVDPWLCVESHFIRAKALSSAKLVNTIITLDMQQNTPVQMNHHVSFEML